MEDERNDDTCNQGVQVSFKQGTAVQVNFIPRNFLSLQLTVEFQEEDPRKPPFSFSKFCILPPTGKH